MKKTTYMVTRFDVNEDFYVEVSPNGEMIEFVLCMKNYGVKRFMYGYDKNQCPEETWEELISITIQEHIKDFEDNIQYIDED